MSHDLTSFLDVDALAGTIYLAALQVVERRVVRSRDTTSIQTKLMAIFTLFSPFLLNLVHFARKN